MISGTRQIEMNKTTEAQIFTIFSTLNCRVNNKMIRPNENRP